MFPERVRRIYQTERAKAAETALHDVLRENKELKNIVTELVVITMRAITVAEGKRHRKLSK